MDAIKYIKYDKKDLINQPLPWQIQGLQQTASGYGSKLTTSRMLRIGKRLYRIYAICYGNAASAYIIMKKERYFLTV